MWKKEKYVSNSIGTRKKNIVIETVCWLHLSLSSSLIYAHTLLAVREWVSVDQTRTQTKQSLNCIYLGSKHDSTNNPILCMQHTDNHYLIFIEFIWSFSAVAVLFAIVGCHFGIFFFFWFDTVLFISIITLLSNCCWCPCLACPWHTVFWPFWHGI